MDTIPLWCIIFINCITLLSSVWILIYLYRNRSKKSFSTYIYGIASLIGLFLGVISFFYYICHAFCAILFGIEIFIDTYMEYKTKEQAQIIIHIIGPIEREQCTGNRERINGLHLFVKCVLVPISLEFPSQTISTP